MTTERMSAERLAEIRHYVDGGMIGYPEFVAELLRELDAVREELAEYHTLARWNVERTDDGGIRVCFGEHDKALGCEWFYFVPGEAYERAIRERDEARRYQRALEWLAAGPHSLFAYQHETGVRWQVPDWCADRDPLSAIEAAMADVYYPGPLIGASATDPAPPQGPPTDEARAEVARLRER